MKKFLIICLAVPLSPSSTWANGVNKTIEFPDGTKQQVLALAPESELKNLQPDMANRTATLDSPADAKRFRDQLCSLSRKFTNAPPQIAAQMRYTVENQCNSASRALNGK